MSALIEYRRSNVFSYPNASATITQLMTFLYDNLVIYTASADSRWEICSHDLVGNPHYVTLKRKNGSNGRIVFIGSTAMFTARASMVMNNTSISANSGYIGWFPNADTDTPLGFTGAGDFFSSAGDAGAVGFSGGAIITTSINTFTRLAFVDSQETFHILVSHTNSTSPTWHYAAGQLLEDRLENAVDAVLYTTNSELPVTMPPASPLNNAAQGYIINDAGVKRAGTVSIKYVYEGAASLRDVSNSRIYFLPIYVSIAGKYYTDIAGYKPRQIAQGPGPISDANNNWERVYSSGPTLEAINMSGNSASGINGSHWFVNFKPY